MRRFLFLFAIFTPIALVSLNGCNRPPKIKVEEKSPSAAATTNIWRHFLDSVRYPDNPRESDDWRRFRDGVRQLDGHFAKADVVNGLILTKEDRRFLQTNVGLDNAELAEIESLSARSADAHYLDECFLLRDAARTLENQYLTVPEQAHLCFRWVMRNMLPHEQQDSNTPPAFALRRGTGSAMERALVFLALLRQLDIEGCLIVAPNGNAPQFLVAALDRKTRATGKKDEIVLDPAASRLYLFDPRLGLAVLGKDGKSVVTLKEAIVDATLLKPHAITPERAKKLEAWIVCPLYALAPRMLEMQRGVRGAGGGLTLYLNPRELKTELETISGLPTGVWKTSVSFPTRDSQFHRATTCPTRWLRDFLPKAEGGLDDGAPKRTEVFEFLRYPFEDAMVNYARIALTSEILPESVYLSLQYITRELFQKYAVQPRELFLHGQYDPMKRRQERLQIFVKSEALAGLTQDPIFHKERIAWVQKVRNLNANIPANPGQQAKQRQAMQAIWMEDAFLRWMLETDSETQLDRADKKSVMTKIVAFGMLESLDFELARVRAGLGHEEADRAQANLESQQKPSAQAKQRARQAWEVARSSWANFYLHRIAIKPLIERQLIQLSQVPRLEVRLSLLEKAHLDLHRYFHARIQLAECIAILDGAKEAKTELDSTRAEIEAFEKSGQFQTQIKNLSTKVPSNPEIQRVVQGRLDLLGRCWSQDGSYAWLKKQIVQRVARLAMP
ncbi:MAG: hypothetical protein HYX68_11370 [Planctomycetes bacterium]|nr:hypothetical protein [Planctomycetota bacterium]